MEVGERHCNNLDPGGDTNKRNAVYDFKAGETYKLVVSGRSKFFRINRIVFRHTSTSSTTAQNLGTPESGTPGPPGPVTIPGRIEAEDYKFGGEGVGYHDTTAGNTGGDYRSDDVDIAGLRGGGYNVGWTAPVSGWTTTSPCRRRERTMSPCASPPSRTDVVQAATQRRGPDRGDPCPTPPTGKPTPTW